MRDVQPVFAVFAGMAALGAVLILVCAKTVAWLVTGSSAVLASLVDSLLDGATSAANFLAIRYALKPADSDHRYGHGKIEGVAALFQSALLVGAGVFLVLEGMSGLLKPSEIQNTGVAVAVMAFSLVVTSVLVIFQRRCLRRAPSLAVEADHAHYACDILMNAGTLLALGMIHMGGPLWIDPLFAVLVAFWLWRTAWQVMHKGLDMLMDKELPDGVRGQIIEVLDMQKDILGWHDLRTRQVGMTIYISLDVELPGTFLLSASHEITQKIESDLLAVFPHAQIMIHQDPAGAPPDSRHPDFVLEPRMDTDKHKKS